MRIGGIASGFDTESMVRDLMRVQRLPLQRLEQDKQVWQWRQEDYRGLNMQLLNLRNKAFDMRLQAPYLAKKVNSTNNSILTATAGPNAMNGTYNINVTQLASAASTYSTNSVGSNVNAKVALNSWVEGKEDPTERFSFVINTKATTTGQFSDLTIGDPSIKMEKAVGTISFGDSGELTIQGKTAGSHLNNYLVNFIHDVERPEPYMDIGEIEGEDGNKIKVINIIANFEAEGLKLADLERAVNEKLGETEQLAFSAKGGFNLSNLVAEEMTTVTLEGGVDEVRGEYQFAITTPFIDGEQITIGGQTFVGVTGTADPTKGQFSVDGDIESQTQSIMRAINGNKVLSHRFEPATIDEEGRINLVEKEGRATGQDLFTPVNGVAFEFTYGDSLEKIISTVNNNRFAGVSMFFDEGTQKLLINSKETGQAVEINVTDNVGSFMEDVMKINTNDKNAIHYQQGTDAEFILNGLATNRTTNNFQINNVSFNLTGVGETKVEVQGDTDKVVENIKALIDLYNETLEAIYGKLNQERFRGFPPLTEEQREAMSEKEIEKWEEKAKSGLLSRDPVLNSAASSLRRVMTSAIPGLSPNSIFALGMKTGGYHENGKIYVDEAKLRNAIEADPEGVMLLFNSSEEGSVGLARQLQNELDRAMRTISDRAGSASNRYDQSFISRTIRDMDDQARRMEERFTRMEDRYWQQFTAMEKALQSMYQQGDWLAQQMMSMVGGK